jgi:hypothetical protein
MAQQVPETPFDSIESAREYLALLHETVADSGIDVKAQIVAAQRAGAQRREQALRLAAYNIAKLEQALATSRRILKGLRNIRALLLQEKRSSTGKPAAVLQPGVETQG